VTRLKCSRVAVWVKAGGDLRGRVLRRRRVLLGTLAGASLLLSVQIGPGALGQWAVLGQDDVRSTVHTRTPEVATLAVTLAVTATVAPTAVATPESATSATSAELTATPLRLSTAAIATAGVSPTVAPATPKIMLPAGTATSASQAATPSVTSEGPARPLDPAATEIRSATPEATRPAVNAQGAMRPEQIPTLAARGASSPEAARRTVSGWWCVGPMLLAALGVWLRMSVARNQ